MYGPTAVVTEGNSWYPKFSLLPSLQSEGGGRVSYATVRTHRGVRRMRVKARVAAVLASSSISRPRKAANVIR